MGLTNDDSASHPRDGGLRAILVYKTVKGAATLLIGGVLLVLDAAHEASVVHSVATWLRHHVSALWSVRLADLIVRHATPRGIAITGTALVFDGAVTSLEGWALRRGHWWGPWLVVIATGALVPFEIYELTRHVNVARVVTLVVNVGIVVYLVRRALRERRARRTTGRVSRTS